MIAAGQINPVRAGYWEDEMRLRFKAPPLSPQVISCHNVPRERDRADSHWKLCKANAAGRRGPSSCSAPRCSWGDGAHPQASRLLCLSNLQFTTAKHKAARANLWTHSCAEVSPAMLYSSSETAARLHSGESMSYSPNPSKHKCTVFHRGINLQRDCCALVF